jgi:hypothetical protein
MKPLEPFGMTVEAISLARYRELLGPLAEELSEEQVDEVRRHVEAMAHLLIEIYLTGATNQS